MGLGDQLYSVAYRILRDTSRAGDAVQQTFLIAWRELPSLRDSSRLEPWLFKLLASACYAEIRLTRRWQPGLRLVADSIKGRRRTPRRLIAPVVLLLSIWASTLRHKQQHVPQRPCR